MSAEQEVDEYEFTKDWFTWNIGVWEQMYEHVPKKGRVLEIGSFEGRSAIWAMGKLEAGGEVICIDTWEGGEDHKNNELDGAEERFKRNINKATQKYAGVGVTAYKGTSFSALAKLITEDTKGFDVVYVDGSHTAWDTLTDACMAFPLLKVGGFLVFDDYHWGNSDNPLHRPKIAVDAFSTIFGEQFATIHNGYQVILQKVKE